MWSNRSAFHAGICQGGADLKAEIVERTFLAHVDLLSFGLAFILAFIGVKLVIHALHENELPFINGGEHVTVIPEVPITVSLLVILVTLLVTTVASLWRVRRDRREHLVVEAAASDPTGLSGGGRTPTDAHRASNESRPDGAGSVSAANPGRRDH